MRMNKLSPLFLCLALALLTTKTTAKNASSRAQTERDFNSWVNGPLWQKAKQKSVTRATFVTAFKNVRLNWSLPDLRPPGQRRKSSKPPAQSEFRAPGGYFKARYLDYNIKRGRVEMNKWRKSLDIIEQQYGVPREIILSIWGKETAFGQAKLPYRAVQVLATQAFMGRRKPLFERELLAALTILEERHISSSAMKSAWAGALGHPQFMPTAFLKYAIDFDGDGRKNIWTSVPDTLASIANYLASHGWDKTRHWGHEVRLPDNVSCTLEGPDQRIKKINWIKRGLKRRDGEGYGRHAWHQLSFLLLPAGRQGPAFLVSKNFYVLKSYNESDVYALFIGHVADRMKAGGRFIERWKKSGSFSRSEVRAAQLKLEKSGADVGGSDGLIGYKTRTAIGHWQQQNGDRVTCFPDRAILKKISLN